ncbi:hypothetical protein ACFSKU_06110 [Pontibacter silvestris]|uniref:Uncharacterized protein n=1 Tax=Pontibacter silvestris TaxID=2305183 RepID=A0ABW4WUP1_9BACT|nr:hypothetical protein [Pontibacter silvestris]MCC9136408.1 hypothetical protein [Pontibacter silvestris]
MPTQEELAKANIGTHNIEGIDPGTASVEVSTGAAGTGIVDVSINTTGDKAFIYAEDMPEFIGGEKALIQYLSKKLRYPAKAQQENV